MSKETIYKPSNKILDHANIKESEFDKLYKESIENPEGFWSSQAELYLDWDKKWNEVFLTSFHFLSQSRYNSACEDQKPSGFSIDSL